MDEPAKEEDGEHAGGCRYNRCRVNRFLVEDRPIELIHQWYRHRQDTFNPEIEVAHHKLYCNADVPVLSCTFRRLFSRQKHLQKMNQDARVEINLRDTEALIRQDKQQGVQAYHDVDS